MLGWVVRSGLQLYLILPIAAASGVYLSYALTQLHFDILPEFNPPIVEIQTQAQGLFAAFKLAGLVTSTLVTLSIIAALLLSFGENSIERRTP